MIFLQLFYTFFKIGLFGFGGGYAMISLIQGDVVRVHHWITSSQFADIVAVSQSTPGPIGINSATYVGYTAVINAGHSMAMGILGSAIATFAVVLPSFLLVLLVMKVLSRYREHPVTKQVFAVIRPAVVGLLAAAALLLMTPENFGTPSSDGWSFYVSVGLFLFAFVGTLRFKIGPILMLFICAAVGLLLYSGWLF